MFNWLFYTIPENKRMHYGICLWLCIFIIPEYLLQMKFTNFITYDILYYHMLKRSVFDRDED